MLRRCLIPMMLLTVSLLSGCGYTQQELFPDDVQTVAVPIFANRSFHQGLEFDLTEALIKEMELRTPYKVVRGDAADTILEGRIDEVTQRRLSQTSFGGGFAQEVQIEVTVSFQWKDLRSGKTLRTREGMSAFGRSVVTQPIGEPMTVAQHQAVVEASNQIVSALRHDW